VKKTGSTPTVVAKIKGAEKYMKASKELRRAVAEFAGPRIVQSKCFAKQDESDIGKHFIVLPEQARKRAETALRAAVAMVTVNPRDAEVLASWAANWFAISRRNEAMVQFYVTPLDAENIEGLVMKPELMLAG
jgi:hypothetical protein